MDTFTVAFMILIGMALIVGIIAVFRKFALWYFKIDDVVDLLTKQLNNQRLILKHLKGEPDEEAKK